MSEYVCACLCACCHVKVCGLINLWHVSYPKPNGQLGLTKRKDMYVKKVETIWSAVISLRKTFPCFEVLTRVYFHVVCICFPLMLIIWDLIGTLLCLWTCNKYWVDHRNNFIKSKIYSGWYSYSYCNLFYLLWCDRI